MASSVSSLRRWFALIAILMIATVAGMYFYARWSLNKAVRTIPEKLGIEIRQTADGFSISKSEQGRTQFTVSASKAVQLKEGGKAELHNVKIIVYGKDASRFDRISGDDFEFDPTSGNVSAKGKVLIDLEANPEGIRQSDQSPPKETKEPLHVETDGLIFNKNTGDASATGRVIFQTAQATGSAIGIRYTAKTGTMELLSTVVMSVQRPQPVHLTADCGVISKQPSQVFLTTVHMTREQQEAWSDQATLFLRPDNTVERVLADGDVRTEIHGRAGKSNSAAPGSQTHERSDRAELFLTGSRNQLTTAILTGNVHLVSGDAATLSAARPGSLAPIDTPPMPAAPADAKQPAEAFAGQVKLNFAPSRAGEQLLKTVHAEDGVRLLQNASKNATLVTAAAPAKTSPGDQQLEMTAPVMDFTVKNGRLLDLAETTGPPRITITQPTANQKTVVTAAKFTARFTEQNRLATLHGEPDAKIVSSLIDPTKVVAAGSSGAGSKEIAAQADRVSSSQMLDVLFLPAGGIRSITQTGQLTYVDGTQKAWAQRGDYTTADQMVVLSGSPRVVDAGMTTTAQIVRINRATDDALADGNVKSTYSELKPLPDGAMLASSDPIHVTSRSMTAHRTSAIALYTGDARLWQNANIVEAPTLQFDRDHRSLVAQGAARSSDKSADKNAVPQQVSTVLVQVDKTGKVTPVHITSARLTYTDLERKVFLDGGVTAKTTDTTMTSQQMTVFLLPQSRAKAGSGTGPGLPGQVDRIIAENSVVITQPTRHAAGDKLVYTASDDKFVLTGGAPSIFDAERGKITGDSLTFYRHDDRVLVEGRETAPAVTKTQVAR
ncbi:MAG TPA: LPS export ABC transporter periplasmic protein LptC [Terriglobales bacterium]|jgi:lipopolysaccharide export system protein LptA|nr:LPS export ABC transporter periplasmic protein LptC [Terriglobales bacterium]